MQITVSTAPRSISNRSSRSLRRRLRAVGAIFVALAVLGIGWGLAASSAFVSATTAMVTNLGA